MRKLVVAEQISLDGVIQSPGAPNEDPSGDFGLGGWIVPYADELIRVPRTPTLLAPVVTTVPLQVLACEIAATRGLDVDQPRNLAKSVTVE